MRLRAAQPRLPPDVAAMKICIYGAGAIGGYLGVQLTGIPTPALDAVAALVVQRGRIAGLYERNTCLTESKACAFA